MEPDQADAPPARRPATAATLPGVATESAGSADKKRSNAAALFDAIEPGAQGLKLPKGKYEAVLTEATLWPEELDKEKGQSIRVKFAIVHPDYKGNTQTTWFRILNADGSLNDGGSGAWKGALARLGYAQIPFDEMQEGLAELAKDRPGAILSIGTTPPRSDGRTFPSIYIESECDNDQIQEYKDKVPY